MNTVEQGDSRTKELKDIRDKGKIQIEMDKLEKDSSQLLNIILDLESRLYQILKILEPSKQQESNVKDTAKSILASDLSDIGKRISLGVSQINSIINRLEL